MNDLHKDTWDAKVLRFWFEELTEAQWWTSTPALDEDVRRRFADTHAMVASADIAILTLSPEKSLAAVIALDQFPRNLFRRKPAAFATDAKARAVMDAAVALGHDATLTTIQRQFLYMPAMHAEDMAAQERAVALFTALGNEENLRAAHEHADIIRQFGRFPHRNAALGRTNTPEEIAYLAGQAKRFGQ